MQIDYEKIRQNLEEGGVLVHPTDTCYGFACFFDNKTAISRIQELKKREASKPFSLLFSSIEELKNHCFLSKQQEDFIKNHSEKSSFILEKDFGLSDYFPDFDTVSVRIENKNFPFRPVSAFGKPCVTTSLNFSGEKPLESKEEIFSNFFDFGFVDFLFYKNFVPSSPSTIRDLTKSDFPIIRF